MLAKAEAFACGIDENRELRLLGENRFVWLSYLTLPQVTLRQIENQQWPCLLGWAVLDTILMVF